jgi:hypothetical protein|eukprot:COSAG01_NODE_4852_length_4683_cov_81.416667_4_plen_50_part_00
MAAEEGVWRRSILLARVCVLLPQLCTAVVLAIVLGLGSQVKRNKIKTGD